MHQSTLHRMTQFAESVRDRFVGRPCRVLEVGSMQVQNDQTYRQSFSFPGVEYVGLDVQPGPNVDFVPADPYDWKELEDDSFDVVVSGQALEHIEFPWLTFDQIARKLKPGGLACLIAPSRGPEHRFPVDCYRFYPDGLRALARWSGLTVLEAGCLAGDSGFQDGSTQWGDCHCILSKPVDGEPASAPPQRKTTRSFSPEVSCVPLAEPVPHSLGSALSQRKTSRHLSLEVSSGVKHSNNPLALRPPENYYAFARDDVIQEIRRQGIQAGRAIELGCSSGATGRRLKALLGITTYVGIEKAQAAAQLARACLDEVLVADLEQTSPQELGLKPNDFDLLLALDVLEHLYDPWNLLAQWARLLRPGGYAVLSIPNVRNITVLQQLVAGRWTYQNAGLLDATHLRFFTLHEITQLVAGAGLTLCHVTGKLLPQPDMSRIDDTGNTVTVGNLSLSDLSRNDVIGLFTYQYLVIARRGA